MTTNERNSIFIANEKLIYDIINKYFKSYYSIYDDLYQVGAETLLNAIGGYEQSKGKLSTYAYKSVKSKISSYILSLSNVDSKNRIPTNVSWVIIKNKDLPIRNLYELVVHEYNIDYQSFLYLYNCVNNIHMSVYDTSSNLNELLLCDDNIEESYESNDNYNQIMHTVNLILNRHNDKIKAIYMSWLNGNLNDYHITCDIIGRKFNVSKQY